MDSTPEFTRLKTLSSNMKLYLIETFSGGFLIYIGSFIIPSLWSALIQALPIYSFIIAAIIILPVNSLFSLAYERTFKTIIKKRNVVGLAHDLIKVENKTYATLMNGSIRLEEPISQDKILDSIIYAPETVIKGPRNQSITIKNTFELKIYDRDEYDELVGRLLIIQTALPGINHTGLINMTVSPTLVVKGLRSLNKEPKLVFLPNYRPLLTKLKTLANQLSNKQKIHIKLQDQKFNLIIEDYKLLEETEAYTEITKLIMLLSQYFIDTLQ